MTPPEAEDILDALKATEYLIYLKNIPPNRKGYTDWELSNYRANTPRYELNQSGFSEEKFLGAL